MDQINVAAWAGRRERTTGTITQTTATQIAATLGLLDAPDTGSLLPPLWHWCAFPNSVATQHLGQDGHPPVGDLLPPSHLKRRMWAGGQLRFCGPLRVGDPLTQITTVSDISMKDGASGPMLLVSVDRHIHGPEGLAVEERQNIVYLDIPEVWSPPKTRALPKDTIARTRMDMTEALLFRFSAVTFNAHRIHYDRAWAQDVEKYPDLVVHGPLQAMLLMQLATRTAGRAPCGFSFRGVHPMFAGQPMDIVGTETGEGEMRLFTGQDGHQGMSANAVWEGTV